MRCQEKRPYDTVMYWAVILKHIGERIIFITFCQVSPGIGYSIGGTPVRTGKFQEEFFLGIVKHLIRQRACCAIHHTGSIYSETPPDFKSCPAGILHLEPLDATDGGDAGAR